MLHKEDVLTKNSDSNKKTTNELKHSYTLEKCHNLPNQTSMHICNFYRTKEDLAEILVPYFASGLVKNQSCIWLASPNLDVDEAKSLLENVVIKLDSYVNRKQIKIVPHDVWYFKNGHFEPEQLLMSLRTEEQLALSRGFDGLRLNTDNFWVQNDFWQLFMEYERNVNYSLIDGRSTFLCSYFAGNCTIPHLKDILQNHAGILTQRQKPTKEKVV